MLLRPFFKHYGSKWSLSRHLRPPVFPTIVEPFAGAAGYSCRYGAGRSVRLYDADPDVVAIWDWILGASVGDVLALPVDFGVETDIRELGMPWPAVLLVQRWLAPQGMGRHWHFPPSYVGSGWSAAIRDRIAAQLPAVSHWRIEQRRYEQVHVEPATWVVDPPYQKNGSSHVYGAGIADFGALGKWCRGLQGQVIVHEQLGADWLPFRLLKAGCRAGRASSARGRKKSHEVVWTSGL